MAVFSFVAVIVLAVLFAVHAWCSHERHEDAQADLDLLFERLDGLSDVFDSLRSEFAAYKDADAGVAKKINERLDGLEMANRVVATRSELQALTDRVEGISQAVNGGKYQVGLACQHSALTESHNNHAERLRRLESLTKPLADAVYKAKAEGKREAKGAEATTFGGFKFPVYESTIVPPGKAFLLSGCSF